MKKFFVLVILFALPIVAYLFFASGKNNFAKLPVLTRNVKNIHSFKSISGKPVTFNNKISIVAFYGEELSNIKGNTFNLDQKILTKYYNFQDFQFVIVLPKGTEKGAQQLISQFNTLSNSQEWKFVFASKEEVRSVFQSFKTDVSLDQNLYTPYVFIVDKDKNLRGRDDDKDEGTLYGYNSTSVAELSNKMNDDIKVILAEYRLELKKYNSKKKEE